MCNNIGGTDRTDAQFDCIYKLLLLMFCAPAAIELICNVLIEYGKEPYPSGEVAFIRY